MEGFGNAECKMQSAECRRHNKPLSSSAMPKPLSPKGDSYQNAEFTPSGREPITACLFRGRGTACGGRGFFNAEQKKPLLQRLFCY